MGSYIMGIFELFLIAVGLSMDAFAVAVCKGLSMKKVTVKKALIVGAYFGIFQAAMPLIGYFVGVQFSSAISSFDHWIAFGLLVIIGVNMIRESREKGCDECDSAGDVPAKDRDADLSFKNMVVLALATSIDALAVGVTFAFLKTDILPAVSFIGVVTLVISMLGVKIGNIFGSKYKSKAELAGGVILILIGLKILLEHLEVLPF